MHAVDQPSASDFKFIDCKRFDKRNKRKLYKILEEDPNINFTSHHQAKCPTEKDVKQESSPLEYVNSLTKSDLPIITTDVAVQLLKIQSKYLDDHPDLCTSRFRHTLHQLQDDKRQILDKLCFQMHIYLYKSANDLSTEEKKRKFYDQFLDSLFDSEALKEKSHLFDCVCKQNVEGKNLQEPICSTTSSSLTSKLQAVLARLVSDYRAIFAIEGEVGHCSSTTDEYDHQEHRKHGRGDDDEDECPEEMKLMKVACEELSLECNSTNRTTATQIHKPQEEKTKDLINRYYSSVLRGFMKKGAHHSHQDDHKKLHHLNHHSHHHHHHHHHHHGHGHHHHGHHGSSSKNGSQPSSPISPNPSASPPSKAFNFFPSLKGQETAQPWSPGATMLKADDVKITAESATSFDRISSGYRASGGGVTDLSMRTKQRKRKERRDSYPELHDKKFSRSSGDSGNDDSQASEQESSLILSKEELVSDAAADDSVTTGFADDSGSTSNGEDVWMKKEVTIPLPLEGSQKDAKGSEPLEILTSMKKTEDSSKFDELVPESPLSALSTSPLSCATSVTTASSSSSEDETDSTKPFLFLDSKRSIDKADLEENLYDNVDEKDVPNSSALLSERFRRYSWSSTSSGGQGDESDFFGPVSWVPHLNIRESVDLPSVDNSEGTRHFGMLNSKRHLDPTHVSRMNSDQDSPKRNKIKQLQRQLSNVRKRLEEMEQNYEESQGYKLSQADKYRQKPIRKLMAEQCKLKRQIKNCRESSFYYDDDETPNETSPPAPSKAKIGSDMPDSPMSCESSPGSEDEGGEVCEVSQNLAFLRATIKSGNKSAGKSANNNNNCRDLESMRNTLIDIEQQLKAKRQMAGRPYDLENMNQDQLVQEKVDIQSALLQYEHMFGHPETDEEKLLVKSIYDRYRSVKRQFRRSSSQIRSKDLLELETIPEELEVPLTMATPQHRINIEITSSMAINSNTSQKIKDQSLRDMDMPCFDTSTDSSIHKMEANLHSMSRYELLQVQRKTREEKKLYRRAVKEKEERVLQETGRKRLPKGQRIDDSTYNLYKLSKAKLKLIEALLSKPGGVSV